MNITKFYTEYSKRKNCTDILLLIAESETGQKFVVGGNPHFTTELVPYEKCYYTHNN